MKNTGTANYDGPIVPAGGLVFIAATNFDNKFRAFDNEDRKAALGDHVAARRKRHSHHLRIRRPQYVVITRPEGKQGICAVARWLRTPAT
jgi:quinoprotein glucose dehydrogenase